MDSCEKEAFLGIKSLREYFKPSFLSEESWAKAKPSIIIEKLVEYFYGAKNFFAIKASELLSAAETVFGKKIYQASSSKKFLSQALKNDCNPRAFFQGILKSIDKDYETLEELGLIYDIKRLINEKYSPKSMVEVAESKYFFNDKKCEGLDDDLLVKAAKDFLQSGLIDDKGLTGIIIYNIKSEDKKNLLKNYLAEKINNDLSNGEAFKALVKYCFAGSVMSFEDEAKKVLELRIADKIIETKDKDLILFAKTRLCHAYKILRECSD